MEFLLNITVRSLLLATLAGAGLSVFRVKSPSARHAVWTLVTAGMLLQPVLIPVLPAVRLRVLRPVEERVAVPVASVEASPAAVISRSPQRRLSLDRLAVYVYATGVLWFAAQLAFAAWFTRTLVRGSQPAGGRRYESTRISVPVTVGRKILLPIDWREWDAGKLAAVLAHEEAHVARLDWAIGATARVNRCLFWFHPLAWWLERTLARLAEQVCDDAALAVAPNSEQYANVLMDMARAAGSRGGRVSGVVAMAKESNVEQRINRILDAVRRTDTRPLGRSWWLGLSVCGALMIYAGAVVQLAPAQTPERVSPRTEPTIPDAPQPRLLAQATAQPSPPLPQNGDVGSLSGVVSDPSGARIPGAVVMIQGPGVNLTVSADALGAWTLSGLRAGQYSLSVLAPGFTWNRNLTVEVVAGVARRIDTNLILAQPLERVTIVATGTPRPAPTARAQGEVRIGGNVETPRRIRVITPQYPPSARDQGITGEVVISAVIGKFGNVLHAQVMNDAPAELRDAALEAVQGWTYTPAMLNGQPVETLTTITLNFQLSPE